jgi:two-component system alkaline phosphatase synthesis response regulator PhoP
MPRIGNVLIIDDEANLRDTLSRILSKAGCETKAAIDGYEAFKLLEKDQFDLVFLDIHLPEVDGLQVLKEIRQRDQKLPVILLTGYGTLQSAVEALRLGATDYLLKPFDPEVLVSRTRMILDEQIKERRKKELQQRIADLQAELQSLEREMPTNFDSGPPIPKPQDRFVKRGQLILDLQARRATFGDSVLDFPPAAFDYLAVLVNHSPEIVDYQTLVKEAQDYQVSMTEARELSKWHIHILRQNLEENPQKPRHVLNVRGVGYRLLVD